MSNRVLFATAAGLLLLTCCDLSTQVYKEGKSIYERQCSSCHGNNQEGFGKLYPSLTDASKFSVPFEKIPCLIRLGSGAVNPEDRLIAMPAFPELTEVEITNVLNFLNSVHWKLPAFHLKHTSQWLLQCTAPQK